MTQPRAAGRPASQQGWVRIALAGLLLAAVVLGVHAVVPGNGWRGPLHAHPIPLGVALELVAAGLMLALHRRTTRHPQAAEPAAALRQALRLTLVSVLIALPLLLAAYQLSRLHPRPHRQQQPPRTHFGRPSPRPTHAHLVSHGGISFPPNLLYALLALALATSIAIFAFLLRRRVRQRWIDVAEQADDEQEQLKQVVESGRSALRKVDDARAAIIACYVAMERSLAEAGAERGAAETPDELLARAAGRGMVSGPAAERLTGLFYEARFSTHPLPAAAREDARQALDALVVARPGVPA
jgi:Domain of unknown function (DUF4129)